MKKRNKQDNREKKNEVTQRHRGRGGVYSYPFFPFVIFVPSCSSCEIFSKGDLNLNETIHRLRPIMYLLLAFLAICL